MDSKGEEAALGRPENDLKFLDNVKEEKPKDKVKSKDIFVPSDWYVDREFFDINQYEVLKAFLSLYKWSKVGTKEDKFVPWPRGATVRLHGLSAKQHNGKTGKVVGYDAVTGRYGVELDDGNKFKLKKQNLNRIITDHEKRIIEAKKKADEEAVKRVASKTGMTPDGKRALMENNVEQKLDITVMHKRKVLQRPRSYWFQSTKDGKPDPSAPITNDGERGAIGRVDSITENGQIVTTFYMEDIYKLGGRYHSQIRMVINPKETKVRRKAWKLFYYEEFYDWKQREGTEECVIWPSLGVFPYNGFQYGDWILDTSYTDGLKSPSNRVIIRRHFGGHGMNTGAKDLKVKAGDIIFIPYFKDCDRLPMRAYEELKLKSADDPEYCFRPRDIHKVKHGKASRYAKKYPTMTKLFGPLKETSELPRLASVIKHRVHQIEPIPWIPTGWPDPADPAPPVVEDGESSEEEMEEARPNPFEFMEAVYYDRKTDWDFDAVRPLGREELEEYFRHTWSQVNIQDEIEDPQELDATRKAFRERIIALNKTFRFYCASNVPVEFMTANQWMQFGVAVGIADRRDPAFSQIFVVTNASEAEEDKKDTQYEEDNPDNMFTFSEFTEALVRVGLHKYKDLAPHEAFKKIATKVLMNGDPQCMEDFNSIFNTPEIWKVYKKFARKTYNVFAKYAAGDKSQVDSLSSMDIKECFMFFKDSEIQVKTGLSRRSLIACFAMAQGIETDDEAGYESDYAEFIRMLGLLARETDPDKPIARSFQEFLEAYILPMKLPAY